MYRIMLLLTLGVIVVVSAQKPAAPAAPAIQWGKCPQLEPSESDKKAKAKVLEDCLKDFPVPKKLTEESISKHQKSIAGCALKKENWFEKDGSYKFSKAESEIKKKKLNKKMETALISAHNKCRGEAKEAFKTPKSGGANMVDQVQFYQSCMDFHITKTCDIKVQQPAAPAKP